jgi:CRISPR-associated protein Csm5
MAALPGVHETTRRLNDELASARNSNLTCLLCMGWGGGFLSKSGFLDTTEEAYRKLLRSVPAFSRSVREGVPFPKTRRVVFLRGQPAMLPGWVRFQLEK